MAGASAPAVSIRDVGRVFAGRDVLRGLSLVVQPGEVFALLGKNGSGKTTLVEILATLLHPTSGIASVYGHNVVRESLAVRRLIGYGPSSLQSFYPRLTGAQNLDFFGTLYGMERARIRNRAAELLERLSLTAAARERVERYSDGMRGRLSIARALLTNAPVLLLDEPTKSLDRVGREDARRLILGEPAADGRARTVVWVTHDEDEARALAGRVGVLVDGAIS